ncbi:MAG: rod shape-determining protein MreD, partial [Lachnospiraceae bacterium]|nr:rod shape-determining protein MreD [Lachnospiraceae bacterium]
IVGLQALILMYIGYLNGKFSGIFYPEDIKLPMALIVVSDLSFGMMSYILMFLLRGRLHFSYYMRAVILPETVYTIVVTLLLYPIILKINGKLEAREKRSAQKFI